MTNKEATKIFQESFPEKKLPGVPACECGWNGEVDWNAHGQKCPKCGLPLT